jgi:hypothetical protein
VKHTHRNILNSKLKSDLKSELKLKLKLCNHDMVSSSLASMFAVLVLFKRCFMTPANITIAFTLVRNAILIKRNIGERRKRMSGEEHRREEEENEWRGT